MAIMCDYTVTDLGPEEGNRGATEATETGRTDPGAGEGETRS